jgi:hypothetical protein
MYKLLGPPPSLGSTCSALFFNFVKENIKGNNKNIAFLLA